MRSTFNVEDLTIYRRRDTDDDFEEHTLTLSTNPPPTDKIVDALDDQIISTHRGSYQKFFVH